MKNHPKLKAGLIFALAIIAFAVTVLTTCEGPVGPQGIQGEKGETGPQGPKGDPGADGLSIVWLSDIIFDCL